MTEQIVTARALNGAGAANGHARDDDAADGPDGRPPAGGVAALRRDPLLREAVRREVEETTLSFARIGARFGIAGPALHRYAKGEGWRRPEGAARPTRPQMSRLARTIADGDAVVARLLRAVDRQIGNIDVRLRKRGAVIDEKDARLLVHLAKTLQTIMALGRDGGAGTKESAERDQVDADLARRIALWAEGREEA